MLITRFMKYLHIQGILKNLRFHDHQYLDIENYLSIFQKCLNIRQNTFFPLSTILLDKRNR